MSSHEFLTADHAVQRTCWASGAEIVVNFGESECRLKDGRAAPPMGWVYRDGAGGQSTGVCVEMTPTAPVVRFCPSGRIKAARREAMGGKTADNIRVRTMTSGDRAEVGALIQVSLNFWYLNYAHNQHPDRPRRSVDLTLG